MIANQFDNLDGVFAVISAAKEQLRPPPDILPSEWAESSVRISAGNARPGPFRLANAPYQREPMNQVINDDCSRVTLMWGAQVGKTMLALCIQGYCIELRPRSQMMMQPSNDDLKTWLETKFNPLIDDSPKLKRLLAKPRGRDGVNTQKMKSFPGGFLMFAWSGSPKTMRGRSAPLIVCDEVDGYERTTEGHPVGLLWQRAATFGDERMLIEISTPTIKDYSYIEKAFEAGDKRRFNIICPECEEHIILDWKNVRWDGRASTTIDDAELDSEHSDHLPDTARYVCEHCGSLLDDGQRIAAIRTAEEKGAGWKAEKPFKGHASYHINELYSTFRRLRDIVQSYLDKLATDDLQTFVNVSLSLTWEEKGERADPDSLLSRRYAYAAQVPMRGLFLTAGIDAQEDRLEVSIIAWGEKEQSWAIAHRVLYGSPLTPDVWLELDDLLNEPLQHEAGVLMPISAACLDTGGSAGMTQAAYDYAKGKTGRRLFAIKGVAGWGRPIVEKPQRKQSGKNTRKVDLFLVGVDEAKLTVMRRLTVAKPGPGYCHFPLDDDHGQEYFKQLTAEKLVTRYVKGQPVREWFKQDKARNEVLDCRVYAYAALKIMNPSFKRIAERLKLETDKLPAPANDNVPSNVQASNTSNERVQKRMNPEHVTAPEKPPEDAKPQAPQNAPILKTGRTLKRRGNSRNFAKNW